MANNFSSESLDSTVTHINQAGEAQMVDVSGKAITTRQAIAIGSIQMTMGAFEAIESGNAPKGDVLGTARLAGIMAAKQTANLIPLCHPLAISKVVVEITADVDLPGYQIRAVVKIDGKTGVEMEAMTAVSVAALTLYDMAKAVDRDMIIGGIRLLEKTGGKSSPNPG
jgi:cyclic pyranopterin monophosphate synthase